MKILILLIVTSFLYPTNLLKNIQSLKMNFHQKVTYDSGKTAKYSGIIYIKKPFYAKWAYKYPIKRNIYINKNKVILDEPELEQVSYMKMQESLELFRIFKNTKKVSKNKYIAKVRGKKYIIFYAKNNIQKIIFKDDLDNDVNMVFSKHKKNIPYKKKFFSFNPPSHYDILE